MNSYIVDEYDLKEYYLINKNFIDEFMDNNDYTKVKDILDKENYNLSYNGYYFNLNKIMEIFKLKKIKLKKKLYKEKNIYPEFLQKSWIKKDESIKPLDKFILVPKNLFDLLYKTIENNEYSKDEFNYKILIGDEIVFLQNRDNNSQFSIYRFEHDKFKIFYYLEFDEQLSFYEDVDKYIKGKGLLNYVIQKNLDTNNKSEVSLLKDIEDKTIGNYINIRKIDKNEINEFKSRERIDKLKNIIFCYNNFLNELWKLQENNISISKIKDNYELIKKNKISFLKTKIILDNDLINLKKKIYFEEINDLMKIEEKEKYQKKEKELVNKLKKLDETQLKKFVKELNIYNPENSDKENNKNKYNFINIETINMLLEKENSEDLKDCYYFKSKDEYFIIFPELKKLYRIDYDKEKDNFKLGEYPPDNNEQKKINFDNFSKNIKDLEFQMDSGIQEAI